MSSNVIVTDTGFGTGDFTGPWLSWDEVADGAPVPPGAGLDVPNTLEPEALAALFDRLALVRVPFPSFADGRGFSLARGLRLAGYAGRLRAFGHVISDQYAMARRCGFDEVEISPELAARQPQEQWLFRANWQAHDYQARLRGAA